MSFGGYLAPRAAAFEPRIGAVVTIDGLFDGYESVRALLTPELKTLLDAEDAEGFNAAMYAAMEAETGLRWYMEHGLWCFRVPTPYDFYVAARAYTLEGIAERIGCPVLVCDAADDHLNPGQAKALAAALGDLATLRSFTAEESAGAHSHPGASVLMNGVVFDWLTQRFGAEEVETRSRENGGLQRQMQGEYS